MLRPPLPRYATRAVVVSDPAVNPAEERPSFWERAALVATILIGAQIALLSLLGL
jgi:hypothetical protein